MNKPFMRVLSLVLVLSLLAGFMVMPITASAAQHEHTQVELPFEQVENDTQSTGLVSSAVEETADEPLFEDTDIVRVSIVLEKQSTIQAGFSTMNISGNAEAMAYRDDLRDQQVEITAKIEDAIHGRIDVA